MDSISNGSLPTSLKTALIRLERQLLRPYRRTLVVALLGMFLQSVLLLPIPLFQGWVLDRLVPVVLRQGTVSPPDSAGVVRVIVIAVLASVACHLARMAVAWKVGTTMGRISQEVVVTLRGALHQKLMRLSMSYFDRQQTGRLMARVTSDVGAILAFLNGGFLQLVSDLILALGISVLLVWLQWRLALVALVAVPLYAVNHRAFGVRLHRVSQAIRTEVASLYALLSERVSAIRVVRSFAQESAELAELDDRIDRHRALSWTNTRTNAWQSALATLISGVGTVIVLAYGGLLVRWGHLTVGELLAFYSLVTQLYNPIVRLTQFHATAVSTQVSVERLFELLDEVETITNLPGARAIVHPRGHLAYRNVSFSYTPGGPGVLEGIDLDIEPGMTVGLLGASGAGKSTLLALAPRFYDVEEGHGEVQFDGHGVRSLNLADLRHAVALVPQQALLFEGTILSNLTYAAPGASSAAIRRALEAADLAALVDSLPRGLETAVGERGFTLSGGQRQRLALARALIADPAVLLLDDCTSALDAETEAHIQTALADCLPGRSCVIVSHKVASMRHADHIVVLHGGRIVEHGTHEGLLLADGHYAATYRQQTSPLLGTSGSSGALISR